MDQNKEVSNSVDSCGLGLNRESGLIIDDLK